MLGVGLWPFRSPQNGVSWVHGENSLRFGEHGTVLSEGTFQRGGLPDQATSALEIWLKPARSDGSGTILSFTTPARPQQFIIRKYGSRLVLRHQIAGGQSVEVGLDGVLERGRAVFLTVTSQTIGSALYINGHLARTFPRFRLQKDFSGRLLLGTSVVGHSDWQGELLGLAVYDTQLTADQIVRHYEGWMREGRPGRTGQEHAIGIYPLDEDSGAVIHNAAGTRNELKIPDNYSILEPILLRPFWREYRPGAGYWGDLVVNTVGFVPLGSMLCIYWTVLVPVRQGILLTIIAGLAVSLTIELLQYYLPTRSSGTTDLITNTLGTILGVRLCATKIARKVIDRIYETRPGTRRVLVVLSAAGR